MEGQQDYGQQVEQAAAPEAPPERVFPPDTTSPNNTLYVSNLTESLKEVELKHDLQAIFAQFGKFDSYPLFLTLRLFESLLCRL